MPIGGQRRPNNVNIILKPAETANANQLNTASTSTNRDQYDKHRDRDRSAPVRAVRSWQVITQGDDHADGTGPARIGADAGTVVDTRDHVGDSDSPRGVFSGEMSPRSQASSSSHSVIEKKDDLVSRVRRWIGKKRGGRNNHASSSSSSPVAVLGVGGEEHGEEDVVDVRHHTVEPPPGWQRSENIYKRRLDPFDPDYDPQFVYDPNYRYLFFFFLDSP